MGMPIDGNPLAAYALVADDRGLEQRRVAYDHEASATDVRERFDGGWTETIGARIEQARADPA